MLCSCFRSYQYLIYKFSPEILTKFFFQNWLKKKSVERASKVDRGQVPKLRQECWLHDPSLPTDHKGRSDRMHNLNCFPAFKLECKLKQLCNSNFGHFACQTTLQQQLWAFCLPKQLCNGNFRHFACKTTLQQQLWAFWLPKLFAMATIYCRVQKLQFNPKIWTFIEMVRITASVY